MLACMLATSASLMAAPVHASEVEPTPSSPATQAADPQSLDPKLSSRHGLIRKLGDWGQYANPLGAAIVTLSEDDSEGLRQLARGCLITIAGTSVLKRLFNFTPLGERPSGGGNSFPSGHASAAMCAPAFLHVRYGQARYTVPFAASGSFVAYSRVWALKHHWRDVLASTALSLVVAHNTSDRRDDESDERRRERNAVLANASLAPAGAQLGFLRLGMHRADETFLASQLFPATSGLSLDTIERDLIAGEARGSARLEGLLEIGARPVTDGGTQTYFGLRFEGFF